MLLRGSSGRHRLVRLSGDHKTVVVSGPGSKTVKYAARLRFWDRSVRVKSLRRRDVGAALARSPRLQRAPRLTIKRATAPAPIATAVRA